MSDIRIIPVEEKHIEQCNAVVGAVARERKFLSMVDAFPMESTREYIMGNIAKGYPHFVAILEETLIGWCDISPNSSREVNKHCATLGLGILKPYRHKGLGRQLLQTTLDAAKQKGILRVDLTVNASNHNAIKLYEKMGFVHEGTMRKEWYLDGIYNDTHIMAILFPPLA